jgi:hypothetical protein
MLIVELFVITYNIDKLKTTKASNNKDWLNK